MLATAAGAAALVGIGFDVYRRAAAMQPATTAAAKLLAEQAGERVKAVVRIESATGPNAYLVEPLESDGGTDYRQTSKRMRVVVAANTAVIMGGAADVKPGAVVQVSGTTDEAHTLHVRKVVILSGYVRVRPDS